MAATRVTSHCGSSFESCTEGDDVGDEGDELDKFQRKSRFFLRALIARFRSRFGPYDVIDVGPDGAVDGDGGDDDDSRCQFRSRLCLKRCCCCFCCDSGCLANVGGAVSF